MRLSVSKILLDSFKVNPNKSLCYYIANPESKHVPDKKDIPRLANSLAGIVSINQKRGLDVIALDVESPSNYEAALIANAYAEAYLNYTLDLSRLELTTIREFLDEEKEKKFSDLAKAESSLKEFQQRGGIVFLDDQAKNLVDQISEFEAQKNFILLELVAKQKANSELKKELKEINPELLSYLEGQVNEPYVKELQLKIADMESRRDVEATIPDNEKLRNKIIEDYNKQIKPLKETLENKVQILKAGVYSITPDNRREIVQRLFDTDIEVQGLRLKDKSVKRILARYENDFDKLPAQSIELAKLERDQKSVEKLYLILEEKYQEAVINERSQLGNVSIIDSAVIPASPSKPNRPMIILAGLIIGLALGVGFSFVRNYLDRTIKNPEEIESKGISVLSWIPTIEELKNLTVPKLSFIVAMKSSTAASESFKALRTRIQYSSIKEKKTILITSTIPEEGKTTIALNLAGTFAQSDKKVLLVDCDLRKPKLHSIFESDRFPGLSDYLFSNVSLDKIIRKTSLENLYYISSGTIPPNPSELLGSNLMKEFIEELKSKYDMIIIDSPPFITVTDAEILFRLTDGTVLVVQANKTPSEAFYKSCEKMLSFNSHNFLGVVLNNFNISKGYGYYYNYYNYYYIYSNRNEKKNILQKINNRKTKPDSK
jgi:tyrosine-protein kinase Etk/Wzc